MKYRLATWNVNGIRACAKKGFIDWMNKSRRQILCLQETKASPDQLDPELTDPKNFHAFFASAEKKGYSGTAIYSHKKLPLPSVTIGLGKKEFDCEGRTIIAEYPDFILINGYFPNGQRDHNRVPYKLNYSREVIKKAQKLKKKSGKEVIICGDVNTAHRPIDLANPKTNQKTTGFLEEERAWVDEIIRKDYLDAFRYLNGDKEGQYTWWTYRGDCRERNIGWRIDYFLSSEKLLKQATSCTHKPDIMGSDHCPVYLDLDLS